MRPSEFDPQRNNYIGLGTAIAIVPGIGLVIGLLLGNLVMGLIYGAAAGVVLGVFLERLHSRREPPASPDDTSL
jgi:hypothetical protein